MIVSRSLLKPVGSVTDEGSSRKRSRVWKVKLIPFER
jgi:hypothetical protein